MEPKEDSLPPLETSFFPRAPAQRWHSVSRRSDLRPLSQGRSNRLLLASSICVAFLLLGGGILWLVAQGVESSSRQPAVQSAEVEQISPAAPAASAPPNTATAVVPATPEFHIVQPGEVLTTIATKYNTTVEYLAELNSIDNVDSIRVGQRLRLVPPGQ